MISYKSNFISDTFPTFINSGCSQLKLVLGDAVSGNVNIVNNIVNMLMLILYENDIKLKDQTHLMYKYKERIETKKKLIILNIIDNIDRKQGVLQFHSADTRVATLRKFI